MRHVSNTSRPLKTNTPIAERNNPTATLWKKKFKSEATSSTIKPTKKNAPHALKSRRLSHDQRDERREHGDDRMCGDGVEQTRLHERERRSRHRGENAEEHQAVRPANERCALGA